MGNKTNIDGYGQKSGVGTTIPQTWTLTTELFYTLNTNLLNMGHTPNFKVQNYKVPRR